MCTVTAVLGVIPKAGGRAQSTFKSRVWAQVPKLHSVSLTAFIIAADYCVQKKWKIWVVWFSGFCINNKENYSLTGFPIFGFFLGQFDQKYTLSIYWFSECFSVWSFDMSVSVCCILEICAFINLKPQKCQVFDKMYKWEIYYFCPQKSS